jgi:hypothetical protein
MYRKKKKSTYNTNTSNTSNTLELFGERRDLGFRTEEIPGAEKGGVVGEGGGGGGGIGNVE